MSHREIFRVEGLPILQNKTYRTRKEAVACPTGDIVLVQDEASGLVFNAAFDPASLVYDSEYQNEQACSGTFRRHLDDVTAIIERYLHGRTLIEVGCGKGYFLDHLYRLGYAITGVDPAYEGDSANVLKARFEPGLGISADGVVLRHVLEHVQDPVEFLSAIARANGGRGLVYVEVPCFDWISRNRAWFDIFYEHVNYLRLEDFSRMFGTVHESGHLFGGQYLYVVADLATLRRPVAAGAGRDLPPDFLRGIRHFAAGAAAKPAADVGQQAIWGAASKGVIFAIHMLRAGAAIDHAVDINPAKQGRFLPGSGIRVSSPEQALEFLRLGADIFVMNSNYLPEISAQSGNRFNYLKVDAYEL
jgi:SAM-dependent methyltransferase